MNILISKALTAATHAVIGTCNQMFLAESNWTVSDYLYVNVSLDNNTCGTKMGKTFDHIEYTNILTFPSDNVIVRDDDGYVWNLGCMYENKANVSNGWTIRDTIIATETGRLDINMDIFSSSSFRSFQNISKRFRLKEIIYMQVDVTGTVRSEQT